MLNGSASVESVVLEVGFADQRPGDHSQSAPKPYQFVVVLNFGA
jgi:hypothetical protein